MNEGPTVEQLRAAAQVLRWMRAMLQAQPWWRRAYVWAFCNPSASDLMRMAYTLEEMANEMETEDKKANP